MKDIDMTKDELEELYWTNSNRAMAKILKIQTGEITLLMELNGIELKGGPPYEGRRQAMLKKIADRKPAPVIKEPEPEDISTIEKLNIAIKGLDEILELADNAYVLELVHNTLKKLKQ